MKNSTLVVVISLIFITGCHKDDSLEQIDFQKTTPDTRWECTKSPVYSFNQTYGKIIWNAVLLDNWNSNYLGGVQKGPINLNGTINNTKGYYQPNSANGMTIKWIGTQNEKNTTGRADLKQSSPNINFHIVLETECIVVKANEAVYGGTITQIKELSGNGPNLSVGWRFYFKVIDNGSSENTPLDQVSNIYIFSSPSAPSLCGDSITSDSIWDTNGYSEVFSPGFVLINNY